MRRIYIDGQYLKVDEQIIEVFTPGQFKAKGVFETILGLRGELLDLDLHMRRLRLGLKILGIKHPSINPLVVKEVLRLNQISFARVRLMVWQAGKQTHVMIAAMPYKVPQKSIYRVRLIKTNRAAHVRLANVKALDYELFSKAYAQAKSQGFDEALLLNRRGHIFEASRANIFWVKNDCLYTPPLTSGCLNGITRQQIIKEAGSLRIPVQEKVLTPEILKNADAAFITNSLIGIKVIQIKQIKIARKAGELI